jgi:hypothetical protein
MRKIAFIYLFLPAFLGLFANSAAGEEFPGGAGFNEMNISYSISGATLKPPKDVTGDLAFTTSRAYQGVAQGKTVGFTTTLSTKAPGMHVTMTVECGTNSITRTRVLCPVTQSFSFTAPVKGGGVRFSATIRMHATGFGGFIEDRVLTVGGFVTGQGVIETMRIDRKMPAAGDLNVPWKNATVGAVFSDDIEPWSVNGSTFSLRYVSNPSVIIPCSFQFSGKGVECRPILSSVGKEVRVLVKGGVAGVRSKKGAPLASDVSWTFTTMPELTVAIVPVQVVDGVDLVRNKPGVTRIKALWPDSDGGLISDVIKLIADVSVTYDGTQTFSQKSQSFYRFDVDNLKPSRIPKSAVLKGNSANFYSAQGQMPILDTFGRHTIGATVKPVGSFGQTTEFTNQVAVTVRRHPPSWISAYDGYSVLLVPVNVGGWQPGETRPTARLASESQALFERLYPASRVRVEGQETVWDLHYGAIPPVATDFVVNNLLRNLARYGTIRHDAIVGVTPHSWITNSLGARGITGDILWTFSHRAAFVSEQSQGSVVPHECGHMLSPPAPLRTGHTVFPSPLEGYDLSRDRRVRYGNPGDSVFGSIFPLMYEDITAVGELDSIWVTKNEYQNFMNRITEAPGWFSGSLGVKSMSCALTEGDSPTTGVVFVDSALYVSNGLESAAIDSVLVGEMGQPSAQPGDGTYSVKVLDTDGATLQTCSFEPTWGTNSAKGTLYAFFMGVLPYQSAAHRVAVYHGTTQLVTRIRSTHAPTIAVTAPGSVVTGAVTVAWSAADTDGDQLSFAVSSSHDNGNHWTPVGFTVSNATSFTFDTTTFPGGTQCLVSVAANDGFNTSVATSGVFTIRNPPRIVWTDPGDGQTNAASTAPVKAFFRDALDPATVTTNALRVFTTGTNPVPGTVAYDAEAGAVTFTPAESLLPATNYFACVATNDLRDTFGQALASNVTWTFTTAPDSVPPEWTVRVPDDGDYNVPVNPYAFVVFDEPLDPATVTNGGLQIAASGGAPVACTVGYDAASRRAWCLPATDLAGNTDYDMVLSSNVTDLAGNRVSASNMTWSFQTGEEKTPGLRLLGYEVHDFVDTNSNGLWDRLDVRFGVEVTTSGVYAVNAVLVTSNGEANVASFVSEGTALEPGRHSLTVCFDGTILRAFRPFNPAVRIAGVTLYDDVNRTRMHSIPDVGLELTLPTDVDGDGIEDWWEVDHGLNPLNPADAAADPDHDFLSNLDEYRLGLDAFNADCDGDSLPDGWEATFGLNPTNPPCAWIKDIQFAIAGGTSSVGYCSGVFTTSNRAYVAANWANGLQIFDIGNTGTPTRLGSCSTPGYAEHVVVDGHIAYLVDPSGLQIIDVADAANPVLLGTGATPNSARDVAVVSNLAYVAYYSGVRVFDVTTPASPVIVGQSSGSDMRCIVAQSNRLYVGDASGLNILDISDPTNPVPLAALGFTGGASGLAVRSNLVYAGSGDAGLTVVDVSLPATPTVLGVCDTPGFAISMVLLSNLTFVADYNRLSVVDVRTPTNPIYRGSITGTARDVQQVGDVLYVAAGDSGLNAYTFKIVDTDEDGLPDDWERLSFSSLTPGPAGDFDVDGISNWGEYLAGMNPTNGDENANGRLDGQDISLHRINVSIRDTDGDGLTDNQEVNVYGSSLSNPDTDGDGLPDGWEIARGLNPTQAADAHADADHDFLDNLSEYQRGLVATNADTDGDSLPDGWEVHYGFNPTNSLSPLPGLEVVPVASLIDNVWNPYDVQVRSNIAFVADFNYGGLRMFDISVPTNLVQIGQTEASYASGVLLQDDKAYLATRYSDRLQVLNVSDPALPTVLGSMATAGPVDRMAVTSNLVFLAQGYSGWEVADVSDPSNPVSRFASSAVTPVQSIASGSNLAYVCASYNGLIIYDVTDPAAPVPLSTNRSDTAWMMDVQIVSNLAYVADCFNGLQILDVSDPAHPVKRGQWVQAVSPSSTHVLVTNGYAYVWGVDLWTGEDKGVHLLSLAIPTNPVEIAFFDPLGQERGIAVSSNRIFIADGVVGGLQIYDPHDIDSDHDGLPDSWERQYFGTLALEPGSDPDGDGVSTWGESLAGMNPTNSDQNANGVNDGVEMRSYNMDPRGGGGTTDTDGDGLTDVDELTVYGTNPGLPDTDGDGLPDAWEIQNGLNPTNPADAQLDKDGDLLSNLAEFQRGTSSTNSDSNGDGLMDGWEVAHELNPLEPPGGLPQIGLFDRGGLDMAGGIWDLKVDAGFVYCASRAKGLEIIATENPTNPVYAGSASCPESYGVQVVSNYAYLAGVGGLHVVDVSDPAHPVRVGGTSLPYNNPANSVEVYSNWAYVSDSTIRAVDISEPTNPVVTATFTNGYNGYGTFMKVQGNLLYVAGWDSLLILDLSNPTNPATLGECAMPSPCWAIALGVVSNTVLLAGFDGGVMMIDVAESAHPVVRGLWATPTRVRGFAGNSLDQVYMADLYDGVYVADITVPTNVVLRCLRTVGETLNARTVAVVSNRVYVGCSGYNYETGQDAGWLRVFEPYVYDSDKDGLPDWWEMQYFGSLAMTPGDDSDGDGIPGLGEYRANMDASSGDQDNDGLNDGLEIRLYGTNPWLGDTDGDGVVDGEEVAPGADGYVTSPLNADTDGDGLSDGEETHPSAGWQASAPTLPDTDGDGLNDMQERVAGTSPSDAADVLKMMAAGTPTGSGGVIVRWASASNRVYSLDRNTNLMQSAWETLNPSIPAIPPLNVYTDDFARGHGSYFYRVRVEP